jgi:hypothetical protein
MATHSAMILPTMSTLILHLKFSIFLSPGLVHRNVTSPPFWKHSNVSYYVGSNVFLHRLVINHEIIRHDGEPLLRFALPLLKY